MFTENLALHQPAWQSRTAGSYTGAERAVDGQFTDLAWDGGQCAVSFIGPTAEWWVDLGGVKNIHHVVIHHVKYVGKSILGIISFKKNKLLSKMNLKLIMTISGINVGRM